MAPDPASRVDARLGTFLAQERSRWSSVDPDAAGVFDSLEALVGAAGKRLRPAFCHWGFVAAGGSPEDRWPVDAGAACELLHAFALLHDDVMDGSDLRRGAPTSHRREADRHEAAGWAGESRRFGDGVAILAGDMALVLADVLLAPAPAAAWCIWNELRLEVNVGQYLDLLGTARRDRDPEVATRIARYKSAKYTVERPLHLGAVLAAPERAAELLPALSAYGVPLGDAFQLRDDLLGAFGDERVIGKPVGDDLREGKPTALLALATSRATRDQRAVLARAGAADLTPADVAAIQDVLIDTGARAEIERRIDDLVARSLAALDTATLDPAAREGLAALAEAVGYRSR